MKKLLTCLCIISAVMQSPAQNPFARYKVEHHDSKNGMPNYDLVKAHGGVPIAIGMKVETEEGAGTELIIVLPANNQQ